ncbi:MULTISPECIES: type III effector [Pseudomonas syringae group]|uniref:type III effector n=1 Tax=Pseudomonas syringae group TaxID=136849 RepID=UPI0009BE216E|nr:MULTISPECIES: type III effector [Pseudomonas syringae group]MCF5804129.1 type III effector [Pseudomonas tremae]MCF5811299.1 type III effector [Pseudomonas tremae]
MGNCVGGATSARQVYSPDRVSNSSDDPNHLTASQLLNVRQQLAESAGLPREHLNFVTHQATPRLRSSYNNLYRRTSIALDVADIQHRYMTGASQVHPGSQAHQDAALMRSYISEWDQMRAAVQQEMGTHVDTAQRYIHTINPDGPDHLSTLTPSPYRNR